MWWTNTLSWKNSEVWSKHKTDFTAVRKLHGLEWRRRCGLHRRMSFCQPKRWSWWGLCKTSEKCFWIESVFVWWVEPHWSIVQPMPGGSGNCHLFLFNAMSSLHEQWPWLDVVHVPCYFPHYHTFPAYAFVSSLYYFWTTECIHICMPVRSQCCKFVLQLWRYIIYSCICVNAYHHIWYVESGLFGFLIPSFCASDKLSQLHVVALEYAVAFYPLLLTVIAYICVQLHARDCRVVVCLWQVFCKCFSCCRWRWRRQWDPVASLVHTFAAFLVLSYSKILFVSLQLLSYTQLYVPTGGVLDPPRRVYHDPSLKWFGNKHLPFALLAIFVLCIFVVFPALVLFALLHSPTLYHAFTWLYMSILHSTMALLDSTSLYYTLLWLYWAILDSTTLYYGST